MSRLNGPTARLAAASVGVGVVAGLVWLWVAPRPMFERTETSATMGERDLALQVGHDAWYAIIAVGFGILLGVWVARTWRGWSPVIVTMVASLLAAGAMLLVGWGLGPSDPGDELRDAPPGTRAAAELELHSFAPILAWPLVAAVTMVVAGRVPESDEE